MAQFAILSSGFISKNIGILSSNIEKGSNFRDLILDNDHYQGVDHFYNKDVNILFDKFINNKNIMNDFDFKEHVLILVYKLFEKKSIYNWMYDQQYAVGKTVSNLHIEFLEDTINYLNGETRKINIYQWARMLNVTKDAINYKPAQNDFFKTTITRIMYGNLINNIKQWLAIEGGYEDLLTTLYVIFGDRSFITTISD